MQSFDYILVGQGIAGTMLSWHLCKAGQRVLVYDDARPATASRSAAGIINPVSGRKFELAWLYETIYPVAEQTYRAIEKELGINCFYERDIWNVWPSAQMRDAFAANLHTTPRMQQPIDIRHADTVEQPFGAGIVKGANVQLGTLLPAWRNAMRQDDGVATESAFRQTLHGTHTPSTGENFSRNNRPTLRSEHFNTADLQLHENSVRYKDITAKAIIFCEGAESPKNPWFGKLKFLPNKGEALLIQTPLHTQDIIKKSITIVPLYDDIYWAGASFSWDYTDAAPTAEKRASLEESLRQVLKVPYTIQGHLAAVRPSGPDRRPLAGMHPRFPQVGIFNGMGSKGCSLAPWAAQQFTRHLLEAAPLLPEIDIKRFFNALR